jgi:hypothetical protein
LRISELEGVCPYRGLEVFHEEDAHFFFGRAAFAEQLLTKITNEQLPLIAVVGASGSGKSSVVRAGLLPRLRLEKAPIWTATIFKPGDAPFRNLAEALALVEDNTLDSWQRRVKANERGEYLASGRLTLTEAVGITLKASVGTDRLLLMVDQFEELFTLTSEADRRSFVDSLIVASRTAPITILLTLRADFYSPVINLSRELSDLIQQGIVNLGPLRSDEWKTVIEEPARLVNLQFQPGLVERILKDVEAQPDSLPLLEYALAELWKRKQGCLITHAQYTEIGGIEGAINRRADDALASLPPAERDIALHILTRLIRVSIEEDDSADTRLRIRLAELEESTLQMLRPFIDARLLVTNHNAITDEDTIEVTHEALIRRWGKLREALGKDREFLYWRRRLGFRMREWEAADHDDGALMQGLLLTEAKRWLTERAKDLTPREREFITWAERDEYQIEQILAKGPGLVRFSESDRVKEWLFTLAAYVSPSRALEAARSIEDEKARTDALQSLTNQWC